MKSFDHPFEKPVDRLSGTRIFMRCSNLLIEIEISSRGTSDQSCSTIEGEVLDRPLDENQNATLELDEVHEMNECPDDPREKTRNMGAEDIRHRRPSADDGHVSLIEILEGLYFRFAR